MSTNNPVHSLGITPGEAVATGQDAFVNGVPCTSVVSTITENGFDVEAPRLLCYVAGDHFDEQGRANARLYADAHNIANSTGLAPSQLVGHLKQAKALLERMLPILESAESDAAYWVPITSGTGVTTLNYYRALIASLPDLK